MNERRLQDRRMAERRQVLGKALADYRKHCERHTRLTNSRIAHWMARFTAARQRVSQKGE